MAKAAKLQFSFVECATDTAPRLMEAPWKEFARKLARPEVRADKDGPAWIGATFRRGGRRDADVQAITAWGLDLDSGNVNREAIAAALNGYAYAAHTTFSSKPEAERWRVIVPLAKPVPPTKAAALFDRFNAMLGGTLDPACKNPARIYYLPACPPDAASNYRCFSSGGELFDASALPDTSVTNIKAASITPAAEIPARFVTLLQEDAAVRLRWEGHTDGLNDTSRSGLDMALAALLVNREFADPEVAAILLAFEHGKAAASRKQYLARTVAKARGEHDAPAPAVSDSGGQVVFQRMADIVAMPIKWLWPGRIARGKPSIIVGDPGVGKSQLVISIAASVTTGRTFPDGANCEPGNVILLSAEDDAADTIRPRLEAAGANLASVFILQAVRDAPPAFGKPAAPTERPFNLGQDLPRLREMLEAIGGVALIVVDPVSAYLGNVDSHRNSEVRALLHPLAKLAAEHEVAVLCVSHLNKGGNTDALMRVTGSLAFAAAARAAYLVTKDNDNPERRLFLPLKNNIGNDRSGLAFALHAHTIAGGIETSKVVWDKDAVTTTANEALAALKENDDQGALQAAKAFLAEVLRGGPVSAKQIKADADGAGHTWGTVRRAKDALRVLVAKGRGPKGEWTWALPKTPKF